MEDPDAPTDRMTAAMQRGIDRARKIHKAPGIPMVVEVDGRPCDVDPETGAPVPWPDEVREPPPPPPAP